MDASALRSAVAAVAAALCLGTAVAQATDPNSGRNLAANCSTCHGTGGRSVGGFAALAGMPKDELVRKMREYQTGIRPGTIMPQLAKGYTDTQIEFMAAWFAAQKAAP